MKNYLRSLFLIVSTLTYALSASAADLLDFVWSGGISDTSVVVVAKTKDHSGTNECKLAVYSDTGFSTEVFRSPSVTIATTNNNSVVKMTANTGLLANTIYYYRIEVNGTEDDTKTGRFKTAPSGSGGNFKIAFGNSNNLLNSQVYGWMQQYDPLFFINTGDFHYKDINDADEAVALARHQAAYENNLNTNGNASLQADFYRNVAFGWIWDDHDFGPNDAHAKGTGSANNLTTPEAQSAVHTAYRQYMPHWPIGLEANTNFPAGKAPIAQAFTIGRVRFILSDIRSQSEQNDIHDHSAPLMGDKQKAWFKEELLKASGSYPLIVWLTTTPWNGAEDPNVDGNKWYQHTGERTEIANFLKDNHIRGFSAIGGDAHMVAIDDGSNTDFSTGGGAGFPIIHAAPIGNKNSYKGGPYSEGANHNTDRQYGAMEFEDRTNELISTFLCLNGESKTNIIISTHTDNLGNPLKHVFTNSWPLITSLSPADDTRSVSVTNDLVMTFNESIQKGAGSISIYTLTNNTLVETLAVTSTAVTVAGNQMTINPASDLQELTAYYVTMDEGVVTDGTHHFPGIYAPAGVDYKKWNFFSEGLEILVDQSTLSVPEGGTNTFMVRLSEDPLTERTIDVARVSGDTNITVSGGASLTFNSGTWSHNQPVTLSAAQDPDFVNSPALIRCSSPGLIHVDITATESDDDPVLHIETSTNAVPIPEGGTNTFLVRLDAQPNATVTVQVGRASGDANITVSDGATLLFDAGNYSTWKTVTLSAAEDTDYSEDEAIINCIATWLSTTTVTATEQENDLGQALPFEETFEAGFPMAGTIGSVDGQHGWTTDAPRALVQTGTVYSGSQALQLQNVSLSHLFTDAQTNPVITLYARLQPTEELPDTNDIVNAAAVFWVNTNTHTEAYNGATVITNTSVLISTGSWLKLELQLDYNSKIWSLDLNGTNLFSDAGFHDTNKASFSELLITESSPTAHSYLDQIGITAGPQGAADSDGDGLPDWWEEQYYGGATNANPDALCSNGVDTVMDAYVAGFSPTNPTARFVITDLQSDASNALYWDGVSGRVYTIYWSSNLLDGFQSLESNVPWTSDTFTDTQHQSDISGFYKLDVQIVP